MRGSSHVKRGTACQDCSGFREAGEWAVAAVSDGHGGDRYFRSDAGSRMAVKVALDRISESVSSEGFLLSFKEDPDYTVRRIAEDVVSSWRRMVEEHDRFFPLSAEETESDVQNRGDSLVKYGATLIAAALGDGFAFGMQVGDGTLACIGLSGEDSAPVPEDPGCFLNVTTSLCQPVPPVRTWSSEGDQVMAIVLATDGVTNTFED